MHSEFFYAIENRFERQNSEAENGSFSNSVKVVDF